MARQEIQRWDFGEYSPEMNKSRDGDYVLWDDVAPILAEVDKPAQNTPTAPCLHRFIVSECYCRCVDCGVVFDKYIG